MGRTLTAIFSQDFDDFEVLSFDNASTDGTIEILDKYPQIRRFTVEAGTYVPGRVLNRAVRESAGDTIVFNNADAIPQGTKWLANIVRPVEEGAAAVYARQSCRPDAKVWVQTDYEKAFGDTQTIPDFFSMASSAAAATVLRSVPFDENIKYSEDVHWACKLRAKGLKTAYAPDAVAEHSHNYTAEEIRRRFTGEGAADAQIFGTPQSPVRCVKQFAGAVFRDFVFALRKGCITQLPESIRARFIQKTAYRRARNAALQMS